MASKRVLLLADNPYLGGITSYILSVLTALRDDERFELVPACFPGQSHDVTLFEKAKHLGIKVHPLPMSGTFDFTVFGTLRKYLVDQRIDLIHAQGYRATLICTRGAGAVPVITTCHGMAVAPTPRLRLWEWARLRAMRKHPLTIACSDFVRQWLLDRRFADARVRTIHSSFALPEDRDADGAVTRSTLGLRDESLAALYIGRLVEGKGIDTFLEAVAGKPHIVPILVGDGPLRPSLEARAEALDLRAHFMGDTTEPGAYYELADCVVLPSEMEALPMTLIEAAAYGKPAVATHAGGIPEVVSHGESGLLVQPGDVGELRKALDRMTAPELRSRMGENAKAIWRDRFAPNRMAEALARAYGDALRA